jgi:hypothetical protein
VTEDCGILMVVGRQARRSRHGVTELARILVMFQSDELDYNTFEG